MERAELSVVAENRDCFESSSGCFSCDPPR